MRLSDLIRRILPPRSKPQPRRDGVDDGRDVLEFHRRLSAHIQGTPFGRDELVTFAMGGAEMVMTLSFPSETRVARFPVDYTGDAVRIAEADTIAITRRIVNAHRRAVIERAQIAHGRGALPWLDWAWSITRFHLSVLESAGMDPMMPAAQIAQRLHAAGWENAEVPENGLLIGLKGRQPLAGGRRITHIAAGPAMILHGVEVPETVLPHLPGRTLGSVITCGQGAGVDDAVIVSAENTGPHDDRGLYVSVASERVPLKPIPEGVDPVWLDMPNAFD